MGNDTGEARIKWGNARRGLWATLAVVILLAVGGSIILQLPRDVEPVTIAAPNNDLAVHKMAPIENHLTESIGGTPDAIVKDLLSSKDAKELDLPGAGEGKITRVTIDTPLFDIVKRYRSMEGPFATYPVKLHADEGPPNPRRLWWWKGAKISVLNEAGEDLGSEFMCHLNLDVDGPLRSKAFAKSPATTRLLTLTQGEMSFRLPPGKGIPVASDEAWSIMFQVLNHNRENFTLKVRQRLELYFIEDVDLFVPMDALDWHASSIWVPVSPKRTNQAKDNEQCPCCQPPKRSLEATNNVKGGRTNSPTGRAMVGHWTVPPGKNTWTDAAARGMSSFHPDGEKLYASWTHIHPFAEEVRFIAHQPGCEQSEVITKSTIISRTDGKIGVERIDSLYNPEGIPLPPGATFEIAVDYDNPTDTPTDSMTSLGLFVDDFQFERPAWASRAQGNAEMDGSCGLGPGKATPP